MILNNYVADRVKGIIIMFVLIDQKREIMEHTVFVMKPKTHKLNAFQNRNLFD